MGMDIAIVAPTDWLPRHRVGFTLICEVEDEGFLHRDRLETRMQASRRSGGSPGVAGMV